MIDNTENVIPFGDDPIDSLLDVVGADDAAGSPVVEKLRDALTPGYQAEFDPAEADAAGAFEEDALSEVDALASSHDTPNFTEGDTQEPTILSAPTRNGMGIGPALPGLVPGTFTVAKVKE